MLIGVGFAVAALERWRTELIEPVQAPVFRTITAALDPVRSLSRMGQDVVAHLTEMSEAQGEADELRTEMMKLEAELQTTREELRRLGRVSGLRQWRSPGELEFLPSDVTGFTTDDRSALFTINRGASDGLSAGLPVVGQKGLAGVIRQTAERTSLVQALTDPLSAVGVADLESRGRGMVFGRGHDRDPEFIPENEVQPIEPGMTLISSGFSNSVYPKGLIIGRIKEKRTSDRGVIYGVIEPAEDFNSLEEVLVIRLGERTSSESMGDFEVEMPAPVSPSVATVFGETSTTETLTQPTTTDSVTSGSQAVVLSESATTTGSPPIAIELPTSGALTTETPAPVAPPPSGERSP